MKGLGKHRQDKGENTFGGIFNKVGLLNLTVFCYYSTTGFELLLAAVIC